MKCDKITSSSGTSEYKYPKIGGISIAIAEKYEYKF